MIEASKPHADGIVIYGMSCSGKTTLANSLLSHQYFCFDAMFHWHDIETLGLSITENLRTINENIEVASGRWVLDGWHLADAKCQLVPTDATIYVVFARYPDIINQYRVVVSDPQEHLGMYRKWYSPGNFSGLSEVRYFYNNGSDFLETDETEFQDVVKPYFV